MTVLGVNLRSMETCGTILIVLALLVLLFAGPQIFDLFMLFKVTLFVAMAILALSMGFIWGYGGILCFGQSAFYGLGAYAYAIAVGNIGESTAPFFWRSSCPPPSPPCSATSCSTAASATSISRW